MIGVIAKAHELAIAEEFFQLFKTPWEVFCEDRLYDVVITTEDAIPKAGARLVLVFGAEFKRCDREAMIEASPRRQGGSLRYHGESLPIYGQTLIFNSTGLEAVCLTADAETAGIVLVESGTRIVRVGYDLFQEVAFLLSAGQPVENAHIPTIEFHIGLLRDLILGAGVSLVEIPPSPTGFDFTVCLTHDIDFVGIRRHCFDHTMWGFLYRSTIGGVRDFVRRRLSFGQLLKVWRSAASLPLVFLGWAEDFWMPFEWYLQTEEDLAATYFLIPFKSRMGQRVPAPHAERRATAYDITDIPDWTATLLKEKCEIGVHGIDAWHSVEGGRAEKARIAAATGASEVGMRMHWLLRDENTFAVLDQAGYTYDSTVGYNETIGFRCGSTQVFRPLSAKRLLELPMHIQDGALFYSGRLDLPESRAWELCEAVIQAARSFGGVLTLLWHDRSHGPERFWGGFYVKLVERLKSLGVWFASAGEAVGWFRKRREIWFERVETPEGFSHVKLCGNGHKIEPPLRIRIHFAEAAIAGIQRVPGDNRNVVDLPWSGDAEIELRRLTGVAFERTPEAKVVLA